MASATTKLRNFRQHSQRMAPPLGPTLAFTEAIKDSPTFRYVERIRAPLQLSRFRHELAQHERYFAKVEKRVEDSLRDLDVVVETGQNFVAAF